MVNRQGPHKDRVAAAFLLIVMSLGACAEGSVGPSAKPVSTQATPRHDWDPTSLPGECRGGVQQDDHQEECQQEHHERDDHDRAEDAAAPAHRYLPLPFPADTYGRTERWREKARTTTRTATSTIRIGTEAARTMSPSRRGSRSSAGRTRTRSTSMGGSG